MHLTISALERAWALKDPALVDYMISLCHQEIPEPQSPVRAEALTFERFIQYIFSPPFRELSPEQQYAYRTEQLKLLAADTAEVALSERLKLYTVIFLIAGDEGYYARTVLLEVVRRIPLQYGAWRALKHIYKQAEADNDYLLSGEISARFDTETHHEFSQATMIYMRRRAWRHLRKLGEALPACYPEAVIHYLAAYPENTDWANTWVANHIFHHQSRCYGIKRFGPVKQRDNLTHRAFVATWRRAPEPLLRLLTMARAEYIRDYAARALQQDFQVVLRDIEPRWLVKLAALPLSSPAIDQFIVGSLQNAPKLEQHKFRELELHEVVIGLLTSDEKKARQYAIAYVKVHARDLPLEHLVRLAANPDKALIKLVQQLMGERDPRSAIGLDTWGQLLEFDTHYAFAAAALRKHFGRKELTPAWFRQRLINAGQQGFQFSQDTLLELHSLQSLGLDYFRDIAEQLNPDDWHHEAVAAFVLEQITALAPKDLPVEFLQMALLNPLFSDTVMDWIANDVIKANTMPVDFYQALVFEPDFQAHAVIKQARQHSEKSWMQQLEFDEYRAEIIREWLSDVRRFSPEALGFEWLLKLVSREEAVYHHFAIELMIRAFVPADFAPGNTGPSSETAADVTSDSVAGGIDKTIDLSGQSFLFTGKLKTMTRKAAQTIVTEAKGKNVSAVTAKLSYLVIGDEGSPLYGNGRKGSKQVKAEALMAAGAALTVISETAFLQMMAGEQREFSADSVAQGCQALWAMATAKPDTPISKFAIKYIRYHHPDLCLKLTDRPVDPGADIPQSFASFARFEPLFHHSHPPLRQLALDYAHYEFARWSPPSADLIALCSSVYQEVRDFVTKALLEEPCAANKRYHIDAGLLTASAVYSFCEAKDPQTRQLGMQIIQQHEKFQQPEALFLLTESPDRALRHFVIRILWSLYRRYATTAHWKPSLPPLPGMTKADVVRREMAEHNLGVGLPERPENLPADPAALQQLLRRWLYELPPGRSSSERLNTGLKPLSASAAKKALIETFRDIAQDDVDFAQMVLPLFENFTASRGAMEQAACLVAITRIQHAHPALAGA